MYYFPYIVVSGTPSSAQIKLESKRTQIPLCICICNFYSLNPSMYYSIAVTVMEKAHIDIHPRKKEVRF